MCGAWGCSHGNANNRNEKNYTELGYKKIRAPAPLFKLLSEFWEKNKGKGKLEQWGIGYTYV